MEKLYAMARAEVVRCRALCTEAGVFSVPAEGVRFAAVLRGPSRRGVAVISENLIQLNAGYFEVVGEAYKQTVAHEYAHLCARWEERNNFLRPDRPHGRRWQHYMLLFGYSTKRSSAYGRCEVAPARRVRKYRYMGVNCGHVFIFGPKRHANAQRGVMYLCATATCKYRPKDERGLAFDKEVS